MADYIVEVLNGSVVETLATSGGNTGLEVYVDAPVEIEVVSQLPDTHYKIGGTDPVADPTILVWYDTLGQ